MKSFDYNSLDLEELVASNFTSLSTFDLSLIKEWSSLMKIEGLFKFKLDSCLPTRILNGKYQFIIQKNPKRYSEKRPSQIKLQSSIDIPFDNSKFNFNKINENEIIFKINRQDENILSNDDYIIINNSPIELGHSLIVPNLHSNLNQILTLDSIKLALDLMVLSNSLNFIIGFNTTQAYASVNHLHLHSYYLNIQTDSLNFPFPIQNVQNAEMVCPNFWFLSDDVTLYPAFSLQLCDFRNDLIKFSKKIYLITQYFIMNDIPHNLVFVKANSYSNESNSLLTIRAVIWPKKHASEIPSNKMCLNFAMCELSGHIFLPNDEDFDLIDEEFLIEIAKEAKLENTKLDILKNDLKNLFDLN